LVGNEILRFGAQWVECGNDNAVGSPDWKEEDHARQRSPAAACPNPSANAQSAITGHVTWIAVATSSTTLDAMVEQRGGRYGQFTQLLRVRTNDTRIQSVLETALVTGFKIELFGFLEFEIESNGGELELFIPTAAQLSDAK
jgi:hypothetical protein